MGEQTNTIATARSMFFASALSHEMLDRALSSGADIAVADLEDLVTPPNKVRARKVVAEVFGQVDAPCLRMVRINPSDTEFHAEDLGLVREIPIDAILLPKATPESARQLDGLGLPVLAVIEQAQGVRLAYEIAETACVTALLLGIGDLSDNLSVGLQENPEAATYVRSKMVVDSAAAGIRSPFDSVRRYQSPRDLELYEEDAIRGHALGMGGKICVHADQAAIVNRIFTPYDHDWITRDTSFVIDGGQVGQPAT